MPTSPKSPLVRLLAKPSGDVFEGSSLRRYSCTVTKIQVQNIDWTLSLSNSLLLKILQKISQSQNNDVSLVCKRWLTLQGRRTLKLFDWDFLLSGRLSSTTGKELRSF